MDNAMVQQALSYVAPVWDAAKGWVLSPAAWTQFGLLLVCWFAAKYADKFANRKLVTLLTPKEGATSIIAKVRRFGLIFLPLLLPLFAYIFTAIGEQVTASIFGESGVIAFGKRVFMFIAARILVRDIIQIPFLKVLGKFFLIPIAALYALGIIEPVSMFLTETTVGVGNIQFSLMALVRAAIAGGILFWLGGWSNQQTAGYIQQQDMRTSMKQLSAKAAEMAIFGLAFILFMNVMGLDLSTLAVLSGAIGVGLGFGLQKIASNFISGVILLVEGQATVGDYVELDGGEAGRIIKMMARATILETFDGKWIVVPNEDFITTRVINYSDSGSANRYDTEFSVSYDTDINKVPAIVTKAVANLDFVREKPEGPDCELDGFGDSGVEFVLEYWVDGIDDGKNKYKSQVNFAIWNALRDAGIEIPFPQRVVHIKGASPALEA